MRCKITVCLIILAVLLTMCGCGAGVSSQEISTPDSETPIIPLPEQEEEKPEVLPVEPKEQFPDGNHDASGTEDEMQEKSEKDSQKVCVVLDESRQKAIDDLLGTEDPGLHYSVPVVIGEGE